MNISTFEALVALALFALALSGMLWVAWQRAPLRSVLPAFLALLSMAAFDVFIIMQAA